MLICSIIIPFMLGGLRLTLYTPEAIFGPTAQSSTRNQVLCTMASFLLIPFHSLILQFKMHYIELKLRDSPNNKTLLSEKDTMTFYKRNFTKVELGLETIYQMTGLFLLFLGANSETPTYPSIGGVSTKIFGIEIPEDDVAQVFLILGCISFAYSFISCITSHLNVLAVDREYFPWFYSKIMASLYTTVAITKRVLSIVLFFTPPLGLFNLLHHWKNEQTKWHPDLILNFVNDGYIQFGDTPPVLWNQIDRWDKNTSEPPALESNHLFLYKTSVANPYYYLNPPHYSLYTVLTLKEWLYLFIGFSSLHLIMILIIKWKFCFSFTGLSFEMIIHAFENTNITYNFKQWDSDGGSAAEHKKRMVSNRNEGLALILVSTIFNILNLLPLLLLGMYV